jgi:hypothetical protein
MRTHVALLPSFLLLSVAAAGCSFELGQKTDGENGNLRFAYSGDGCLFGCGLDRTALQGSMVSVSVEGGDANVRPTARVSDASIARVSRQTETCSCRSETNGKSSSRGIEPNASCAKGETKSCSVGLEIETSGSGDAKLEIGDPSGKVIDRVTVRVRPAARIEIDVKQGATKKGDVYEVQDGFKVKLGSKVYDADGAETFFTKHGVSHEYADRSIIKPDSAVLIGSTDVEDMIADGTGETTVTVHAEGADKVVRFRVVP